MKLPNCTSNVSEDQLQSVHTSLKEVPVKSVSQLFKILSDETRVKIAHALTVEKELCVCDVAAITDSSVATASHHLRTLKKHGLSKVRKEGKNVYYSLDDHHVHDLIKVAVEHQEELEG
ncbi:ArsR/SmtB family transcription factor [Tenuibacillus multivorans]|uniref:DNA-binding transcriptional regulator, ArsR family n=1 Tax=Tenuibacillus multivorans TaxID=237069 RepID=A0A1H0B8L8_9BACI|nr:metalloregulator ArsR/SmtB family transcription factor [Tenuibacillus multivorans]GEL78600.1 transcriptional regulator [Tenuibacillus multivorans]SDN42005.1 DNA-binding transcriptional regulator, ArsR family [Tenuibacillus multivorans]